MQAKQGIFLLELYFLLYYYPIILELTFSQTQRMNNGNPIKMEEIAILEMKEEQK